MNLKIRIVVTFALVALTIGLFSSPQSASAVSGGQKAKGKISIFNNFDGTTQSVFTSTFTPTPDPALFARTEDLEDVIVGTWNWACCKNGAYSGAIVIRSLENGEIVGSFDGAGGGSVVGHVDGQKIHFRRTSDACSSDGKYQDWTGNYNPRNRTIAGKIGGCNVNADENIKSSNSFTMTKQ